MTQFTVISVPQLDDISDDFWQIYTMNRIIGCLISPIATLADQGARENTAILKDQVPSISRNRA